MIRERSRKRYITTTFLFFIALLLQAQTAFWQTDNSNFYVGDYFIASLIITGNRLNEQPNISSSDEFSFQLLEKKKIEDKKQETTIFRYKFIPLKSGALLLPKTSVKNISVENFSLLVKKPQRSNQLKLKINLSSKECYQYQPITLYFNWESATPLNNIRAVNINIPIFGNKDFKVFTLDKIQNFAKHDISLPVAGRRIIASVYDAKINNIPYKGIGFKITIVPQKAGTFTLKPATILCSYLRSGSSISSYPAYFDNNMFYSDNSRKHKRMVAISKTLQLHVKKLPKLNKPANFSGLFGTFKAKVNINEQQVETGQSFKLKINIEGYQHPETFNLPELSTLLSKDNFRYTEAPAVSNIQNSAIILDKLIRIKNNSVTDIPELKIPYFDIKRKQYAYVKTNELAIQVLPSSTPSYKSKKDTTSKTIKKNSITKNPNGIRQLYTDTDALQQQNESGDSWFWLSLLILPLLVIATYKAKRHFGKSATIHKKNIRKAWRHFNKSKFRSGLELQSALELFFDTAFDMKDHTVLPQQIKEIVIYNCPNINIKAINDFYTQFFKDEYGDNIQKAYIDYDYNAVKACVKQITKSCLK